MPLPRFVAVEPAQRTYGRCYIAMVIFRALSCVSWAKIGYVGGRPDGPLRATAPTGFIRVDSRDSRAGRYEPGRLFAGRVPMGFAGLPATME